MHPKIEIINSNKNFLYKEVSNVIALITEEKINVAMPQFKKNQIDLIVEFILKYNE